jgi:hypothetical protein
MSVMSTLIKRRIREAAAAAGMAAVAGLSPLASPGSALASPVAAGMAASTGALHPDDDYQRIANATLDTRIITLWINNTAEQWHAEISAGGAGDKIHLDYTNVKADEVKGKYSIASATITSPNTFVNTSDHTATYVRACGFVGTGDVCTPWAELIL